MTQREYLVWVSRLAGDCVPAEATDQDYIKWARKQGMNPTQSGGWNLDATLSQGVLAQTLAQFFSLGTPKPGTDYVQLLLSEGIDVPDGEAISREDFVSLIDQMGFQGRTWLIAKCHPSPTKPSKKPHKPPMPPQPPKHLPPVK